MGEQLAGGRTFEKLKAKSPDERYTIWHNARRLATPEALRLAQFIETSGLDYAPSGGISLSDPRMLKMRAIIASTKGRQARLEALTVASPRLSTSTFDHCRDGTTAWCP
jgi:hypothetical protein